jgi:predicted dehydrogenase
VYCEKPLSDSLEGAQAMVNLAESRKALTHVAFVLRYLPAIRYMKALMERETIGEVLHFRAHMHHGSYLNPERPMSWRLRHADSGGGAFMDLGIHLVDLVHYILGPTAVVRGQTRTFIEERPAPDADNGREPVDVDDWALCTLTMEKGAVGTIEATRMASGATSATGLEVYGSRGALIFRADRPDIVRWHDLRQGRWTELSGGLSTPEGERPLAQISPSGKYSQGYSTDIHLASAYDFLLDVVEGKHSRADFRAGLAAQEVADALYRSAERNGALIELTHH